MGWEWSILSLLCFIFGSYLSIFSAYLFDAPNSTSNPFTVGLFLIIISIPVISLAGILTGSSVYPLFVIIMFFTVVIFLLYAISSVPFTTIRQQDMKGVMRQLGEEMRPLATKKIKLEIA
jgi:hypothetical protein